MLSVFYGEAERRGRENERQRGKVSEKRKRETESIRFVMKM